MIINSVIGGGDTLVTLTVNVSPATATVSVSGGGLDATTTKEAVSGVVEFRVKPGYDYGISASYAGYLNSSTTAHVDASGATVNVTLGVAPTIAITQSGATGTITIKKDETTLVEGTDYTAAVSGNVTTFTMMSAGTFIISTSDISYFVTPSDWTTTVASGGSDSHTFTYLAYPILSISQSGAVGSISLDKADAKGVTTITSASGTFTLVPETTYAVTSAPPTAYVVDTGSYNKTLIAGATDSITFTYTAYPTITISQSPVSGTVSFTPTPVYCVSSGNVYTISPDTYGISVSRVSGYLQPDDIASQEYSAGETYSKSFTHLTNPVVNVDITDTTESNLAAGIEVTIDGTTVSAVRVSDSLARATFILTAIGTYTVTYAELPENGHLTNQTDSVTISAGGTTTTVNTDLTIRSGYGYAAVQIAINTANTESRCTYPQYVTVNGVSVPNSAYGLAPAFNSAGENAAGTTGHSAFDMGGWANHPILDGIKPVQKNGDVWTDLNKTDMTNWDSTNDSFTEFLFNWLSITNDGTNITIIFSDNDTQPDSTFQCYAFAKGCDSYSNAQIVTACASASRDAIMSSDSNSYFANSFHIGCFTASGGASGAAIYSKRGATVATNIAYAYYWKGANARGTDYDCMSFQQWTYIQCLFLLLYRSTDSQTRHSHGLAKVGSETLTANSSNTGVSTTTYGMAGAVGTAAVNAFFWIYNAWGNHSQFIGGLWNRKGSTSKAYYWLPRQANSRAFNNGWTAATTQATQDSLGTDSGLTGNKTGGFISSVAGTNFGGLCPTAQSGGSSTTYWPDRGYVDYYSSNAYFPYVGGSYGVGAGNVGVFSCYVNYNSTNSYASYCARLSYRGGHW